MPKLNPKPATLLLLLGSLLFVSVAGNGQTLYNTSCYTAVSEDGPPSEFPGAIVKYDVPSGKITKVHDFIKEGYSFTGPTICRNGKIYGVAGGGKYGKGTLYVFDTATAELTILEYFKHYGSAYNSKLIQAADGKLYGVADSAVFSLDPATNNYTIIKYGSFSIYSGQIVQALNGKLYGTTTNGGSKQAGSIYSVDLVTHEYADVFEFDSLNGKRPSNLVLAANGKLYGTTDVGGSKNIGVIFSFDPTTNIFTKVKEFNGNNGSRPYTIKLAADGKLYGSAGLGGVNNLGVIFSYDPALDNYAVLKSFSSDEGGIPREIFRASDGNFYGVVAGFNAFYSFNPITNVFKFLYASINGLSEVNGKLFGADDYGLISFDLATETLTRVVVIGYNNGVEPEGSLVQAPDGKLYGTTRLGGDFDNGTIYSFDPVSSEFVRLKSFRFTNGYAPETKLLPAKNGKLYGTTSGGGTTNNGVLFSFDPVTKVYKKLIDFDSSIGKVPGTLIQAANGMIYGTTNSGGRADAGVIFSYNINTAAYKMLYHFSTATGCNPAGAMVLAKNGLLYGTTTFGGPKNQGIFFSFNPATAVYTPLLTGIAYKAQNPYAGLMQAADGKIYGTAIGKGYDDYGYTHNVLFSFDPSDYSIYLSKEIGADIHTLMQASDGLIYGAFFKGYYKSYVFSFNPKTHIFRIGKNVYDKGILPLKSFVEYLPAKPAAFNPAFATERKMLFPNTSFTVKVFPNPSFAAFRLAIQSPLVKEVEISVTDIAGRTLYQTRGSSSATYSFGNTFAKGIYFVRVAQGGATETLRLEKGGL